MIKRKFLLFFPILLLLPAISSAALVPCGPGGTNGGKACTFCDLFQLLDNIVKFAMEFSLLLATAFIIYGGVRMIFSAGNPKNVEAGQNAIKNALIGLVLLLCSWLIVDTFLKILASGSALSTNWGPWHTITCQ